MNIALLGATGFVGAAILNEALDRGHFVTAIVRLPRPLPHESGSPPRGATSTFPPASS